MLAHISIFCPPSTATTHLSFCLACSRTHTVCWLQIRRGPWSYHHNTFCFSTKSLTTATATSTPRLADLHRYRLPKIQLQISCAEPSAHPTVGCLLHRHQEGKFSAYSICAPPSPILTPKQPQRCTAHCLQQIQAKRRHRASHHRQPAPASACTRLQIRLSATVIICSPARLIPTGHAKPLWRRFCFSILAPSDPRLRQHVPSSSPPHSLPSVPVLSIHTYTRPPSPSPDFLPSI